MFSSHFREDPNSILVCHTQCYLGQKFTFVVYLNNYILIQMLSKLKYLQQYGIISLLCVPTQKGFCSLKPAGCKQHIWHEVSFVQLFHEILPEVEFDSFSFDGAETPSPAGSPGFQSSSSTAFHPCPKG